MIGLCGWKRVRREVLFRVTTGGRVVRMVLQTRAGTRCIEGLASESKRYTTSFCKLLCQQRGPLRPFGNNRGRGSGRGRGIRCRSPGPFIYQVWCNSIFLETRYTGNLGCCCSCSAILPSCQRARRARGLGSGGGGGGAGRAIAAQLVLPLSLILILFLFSVFWVWEWEWLYRYRLRLGLRLGLRHGHGHGQRYGCGCRCRCVCRCGFTTVGAHRYSSRGS